MNLRSITTQIKRYKYAIIGVSILVVGGGSVLAIQNIPNKYTSDSTSTSNNPTVSSPPQSVPQSNSTSNPASQPDMTAVNQDLQNAQNIGAQEQQNAAMANGLMSQPVTSQPISTPVSTVNTVDCTSYDTQISSLNQRLSQIPTFSQYLASSGTFGSPPGGTTALFTQYENAFQPQINSIDSQMANLHSQYPSCS